MWIKQSGKLGHINKSYYFSYKNASVFTTIPEKKEFHEQNFCSHLHIVCKRKALIGVLLEYLVKKLSSWSQNLFQSVLIDSVITNPRQSKGSLIFCYLPLVVLTSGGSQAHIKRTIQIFSIILFTCSVPPHTLM